MQEDEASNYRKGPPPVFVPGEETLSIQLFIIDVLTTSIPNKE
jgi:hypothetical protein